MQYLNKYRKELIGLISLVVLGQLFFAVLSPGFTRPHYEGRIYATTGVRHKTEDLHKLNEAAHYFGQTMIGWLKFPHFFSDLQKNVTLPEGSQLSAHIQERQNIIFTLSSPAMIDEGALAKVKDFVQSKIDEYNTASLTEFTLTNLDYEQVEIRRSYAFGSIVTLLCSFVIAAAVFFVRAEFR